MKWGVVTETGLKLHFRPVSVTKPKPNFSQSLALVGKLDIACSGSLPFVSVV